MKSQSSSSGFRTSHRRPSRDGAVARNGADVARRAPAVVPFKRAVDVIVASVLLLATLPLFLVLALAIVLETRGPVFFRHTRIGKGGKRFHLLKFRSMVTDADAVLARHFEEHPDHRAEWLDRHKLKDDPRVTRIGRILRRFTLDELPQLLNVLRGEMSMVGPRPIVDEEVAKYGNVYPMYLRVFPGLTGLWQVSDRSQTSYRERTELDLKYIQTRTLGMDLLILIKTVRVVLFGHGAY